MELLIGVLIGFFIQWIIRAGWRMLNPPYVGPPQPPNPGQIANRAAYDAAQAATPRVVRVRVQRRTQRGRRLSNVEREYDPFE